VLEPLRAMAYTVPMNWLVFAGKTDKKQAGEFLINRIKGFNTNY